MLGAPSSGSGPPVRLDSRNNPGARPPTCSRKRALSWYRKCPRTSDWWRRARHEASTLPNISRT
eukprot:8738154-Alexandrium_andersonii.AAC.1